MATLFWYRVTNQFEITIHDIPDLSLKKETKFWIEAVSNNRIHTTSISKNDFELCDYNIFDNTIEPIQITEQNLTCTRMYERIANTWGSVVCFEIKDAENVKRKIEFGSVRLETGKEADEAILDGINFMKKFGSNKTWEIIDLKREIIKLKKEIDNLTEQISQLRINTESNIK